MLIREDVYVMLVSRGCVCYKEGVSYLADGCDIVR